MGHDGSCPDDAPLAHRAPIQHHGADANPGFIAHRHSSTEMNAGREMYGFT
jgi:hypothetical protein